MTFFDFDFIENFFFVSLGITLVLIMLLVYHFKQRITSMERKGDTMYELITNVVKELQFMKKLNAYYETLFQNTGLSVEENPVKEPANNDNEDIMDQNVLSDNGLLSKNIVLGKLSFDGKPSPDNPPSPSFCVANASLTPHSGLVADSVVSPTTNNIVMNLNDNPPQPKESHINSRIVVSEDESSVTDDDEESDSDETDLNYSTTDDDSEEDEYNKIDETPEKSENPENEEPITTVNQSTFFEDKTPDVVSPGIQQSPVEMNHLMEMIQNAFTTGMVRQEPPKFAPYYGDEMEQPNIYKPVILHDDEPIVELDISGLEDFSQHPEQILSKDNVLENIVEPILSFDTLSFDDVRTPYAKDNRDSNEVENEGLVAEIARTPERRRSVGVQGFACEAGVSGWRPKTPSGLSGEDLSSKDNVPVPPVDKKQTREVYRKMNITQLRGIATAAGITVDTTKMKKNELIQLLENLEE